MSVALVYFVMATGAVLPFMIGDIVFPIHTAIIILFCGSLLLHSRAQLSLLGILFFISPLLLVLLFSMMRTWDISASIDKVEGAVLATIVASFLAGCLIQRLGIQVFLERFVAVSFIVLVLTIFYRVALGLEGRGDRFFLNGPNVFGWMMGLNAFLCVYFLTKRFDILYVLLLPVYVSAVFWTGSKGPLIALLIPLIIICFKQILSPRMIASVAVAVYLLMQVVGALLPEGVFDRFWSISRLITGRLDDQDFGSIGIRQVAWRESFDMFISNPFLGVGLGNWSHYSSSAIQYPHNFVLEALSEMGIVGGLVILGSVLFLFLKGNGVAKYTILFFAIALSFSGDLSYLRLLLVIPLAELVARQTVRYKRAPQ